MTEATPTPELVCGSLLNETYRLVRRIGRGGMGAVFEAEHQRLPRHFAIKVLGTEYQARPELAARFRREAETTSRLGHPNIVEVVDFNVAEAGTPYIVMELLDGEDLQHRLDARKRLSLAELLPLLSQIASALTAAHSQGVIHRDLKPSNVFLAKVGDGAEIVKLLDFGISKVLGPASLSTGAGTVFGTPWYMAPEQAEGRTERTGPHTDVFALCAIVVKALSGVCPFDGESIPTVLYKVVHAPPDLAPLRPWVSDAVVDVIRRGFEKSPEQRIPTPAALCAALHQAVTGGAELSESGAVRALSTAPPEAFAPVAPVNARPNGATLTVPPVDAPATFSPRGTSLESAPETSEAAGERTAIPIDTAPPESLAPPPRRAATAAATAAVLFAVLVVVGAVGVALFGSPRALTSSHPTHVQQPGTVTLTDGSLARTEAALTRSLAARPCQPRARFALSLMSAAPVARLVQELTTVDNCAAIAPREQALLRGLARLLDGATQSELEQTLAPATLTADAELLRVLERLAAEEPAEAAAALDRWDGRLTEAAAAGPAEAPFVDRELGLTLILAAPAHLLPWESLRSASRRTALARAVIDAQASLAHADAAARAGIVRTLTERARRYEPALDLRLRLATRAFAFDAARTLGTELARAPLPWQKVGIAALAETYAAQGQHKIALAVLLEAAKHNAAPSRLRAQLLLQAGDLCMTMRRRGCAVAAYSRAALEARREKLGRLAARASLGAALMSSAPSPGALAALAAGPLADEAQVQDLAHGELDYFRAWANQWSGRRIQAGELILQASKHPAALERFRTMAAEFLLDLGRAEDARALLAPLVADDGPSVRGLLLSTVARYEAARAAHMTGRIEEARRHEAALVRAWGHPTADLLGSTVWQKRVQQTRELLSTQRTQDPVLYGRGITVQIGPTATDPSLIPVSHTLARALRERFRVTVGDQVKTAAPGEGVAALELSRPAGGAGVLVRRLDGATRREVLRTTIKDEGSAQETTRAATTLFPYPEDPRLFGDYVAGLFGRCVACLRRVSEGRADLKEAGVDLTLTFAASGAMLPSRIHHAIPSDSSLLLCLRGCVERFQLPRLAEGNRPSLSVRVLASSGPNFAMIRTLPSLESQRP